ncbi:virion core protein, T7 gp14 family [Bordetella avium]|uniref:virion core protein, T7 gp14 family n=1 Tax=Bordetella avium TaxID=521 RepID=UPI00057AF6FF|nr:phage protein [Bordetella avium]
MSGATFAKAFSSLALGSSVVSLGSGVVGSYYGAKAQKNHLNFQASIADIDARIAELGAQQELLRGQQEVGRLTLGAGQLKGQQRAALAASGIDLGEGSAAEVQVWTDMLKDIDASTLTANAVRSAWGHRIQGVSLQGEARMTRAQAKGIRPGMSAATSLLESAGSVASSWYKHAQHHPDRKIEHDSIDDLASSKGWW